MPQAFITKSSYIQGYDCPVRLKYTVQKAFTSTSQGDDFLRMLSNVAFQGHDSCLLAPAQAQHFK